jgi:hypothetical protein
MPLIRYPNYRYGYPATNVLKNQKIVQSPSDLANPDSDTEYFIDGVIDMGATSIEIPVITLISQG